MFRHGASNRLDHSGLFEDWEVQAIKSVARAFCRPGGGFAPDEFDDLLQEGLIQWWQARDEPADDPRVYLRTVVRNRLRTLLRERASAKRRTLDEAVSLDWPLASDSGPLLGDVLPGLTDVEADLQIDLSLTARGLSQRQHRILEMRASGQSVTSIGKTLDLCRGTVHEEIRRIRALFASAGLREYLGQKKPPDTL